MRIHALQIFCACCGVIFCICPSCYRGHKYWGASCRKAGYGHAHRKAQWNYRQTDQGKLQHANAEARRRWRKKHHADEKQTVLRRAWNTCVCLTMKLKTLYLDFHPDIGFGRCVICGNAFAIDENCIKIVEFSDPIWYSLPICNIFHETAGYFLFLTFLRGKLSGIMSQHNTTCNISALTLSLGFLNKRRSIKDGY